MSPRRQGWSRRVQKRRIVLTLSFVELDPLRQSACRHTRLSLGLDRKSPAESQTDAFDPQQTSRQRPKTLI